MIHLEPQPPETVEVAPLDAYVTAKPDEPVFTLQGGDPLAAPLVRVWVVAARVRTGLGDGVLAAATALIKIARDHSVADDERERDSLLLRATAAEEVSWAMDDYVKGNHGVDRPSEAEDTHLTELQRIDLHDLKVRASQRLSSFMSEIAEMSTALEQAGFDDQSFLHDLWRVGKDIKVLSDRVEPRRIFKS